MVKNDNCVLPLGLLTKMTKKIQIFFGECLRSTLHKSSTKFLKKNKNDKIWQFLGNFYQFFFVSKKNYSCHFLVLFFCGQFFLIFSKKKSFWSLFSAFFCGQFFLFFSKKNHSCHFLVLFFCCKKNNFS